MPLLTTHPLYNVFTPSSFATLSTTPKATERVALLAEQSGVPTTSKEDMEGAGFSGNTLTALSFLTAITMENVFEQLKLVPSKPDYLTQTVTKLNSTGLQKSRCFKWATARQAFQREAVEEHWNQLDPSSSQFSRAESLAEWEQKE